MESTMKTLKHVITATLVVESRGENPSVAKVCNELAQTQGAKVSPKMIADMLRAWEKVRIGPAV